jgi:hypothetical protein
MKIKLTLTFLVACTLAMLFCGVKGYGQTPPYTGTIDSKLTIPCAKFGKNYHLTGDRLGGSGSDSINQVQMDFLLAAASHYSDSLFAAVVLAPLVDTTTTIIGDFAGIGLIELVDTPRNTYGRIRYTNNTAGAAGSGKQIKVAFRTPYNFQVVPVVSLVSGDGIIVRLLIIDPQPDSFIVELKDDIGAGESIDFTYHVKAE